ncbi:MAG TPA: aminotransferase class V-fold PLP-dependent enzyme, partial [Candidatus Paceibacterota bacterium]|nr:aminotransferase class V-fold PLP-dependent enzyme [Candidatus Paceibacterota bacterium]
MKMFSKRKIYLDYAGATPLDKEVSQKISSINRSIYSNPSSIFGEGKKARDLIEKSRGEIAEIIGAH